MVRLKASSLLETLVAMSIICIVATCAFLTVEMTLNSNRSTQLYRVELKLAQLAQEAKQSDLLIDRQIDEKGIRVKQEITPYQNYSNLFLLELNAYNRQGRKIGNYQELVIDKAFNPSEGL